ncbi:hypothetical protein [Streptomyces qinzhouensis]|uniref:hypothetical protein n=1 Tax=Streptomyces qinzhouensis TaxID=2599401 RepID=UPI001FE35908|nr:hypothetical protein [Streptomyces qinzhouensis]
MGHSGGGPAAENRSGLVAAEDLLLFVNAAITATGQREFRSGAAEQQLSLAFLHEYVQVNHRSLYAAALALDINDHNAALIVERLLRSAREATAEQKRTEGRLIAARLALLPPQRVYRLFRALRTAGVNNRRTRAVQRDWLTARPDLGLDAVKYRRGLKSAVRHVHLPVRALDAGPLKAGPLDADRTGELGDFLFRPGVRARYGHPLLDAHRRAHYEQQAVYELPFTVAQGFAARHRIPPERFLERITPRMTRLEKLRTAEATGGRTGERELSELSLTRLALYALSLPRAERAARRTVLTAALRSAARRAAGPGAGAWGRVSAVLDDSYSSYGSGVKRRRPLAVALAAHFLLEALATAYRPHWTSGLSDPLMAHPVGPTPLGTRILDALADSPDRLVIVSDGWDNAPPGLAGEVLRLWRTALDPGRATAVVHVNPVYDADGFDVRRLAPSVPTVGIRDAEDLPALVEIAQFAEGRTGPAELRAYLDRRSERFLRRYERRNPEPGEGRDGEGERA